MKLSLAMEANAGMLYNGHHSVWLSLTLGRRHLWLSRWDTARVKLPSDDHVILHRGALMTWYCGGYAL